MTFGVAIPAYNGKRYIHACLESIFLQDSTDLESVVLSDDGSSDGTAEIARSIGHPKLVIMTNPRRTCPFANFRNAAKHSKGDFVCMLNQDDLLLPGYFEHLKAFWQEFPTLGTVNLGDVLIDEDGTQLQRQARWLQGMTLGEFRVWLGEHAPVDYFIEAGLPAAARLVGMAGSPWTISGSCTRRSVFEDLNYFDPSFFHLGDLDFAARLVARYRIGFRYVPGVAIRMHSDQLSWKNHRSGRVIAERYRLADIAVRSGLISERDYLNVRRRIRRDSMRRNVIRLLSPFIPRKFSSLSRFIGKGTA